MRTLALMKRRATWRQLARLVAGIPHTAGGAAAALVSLVESLHKAGNRKPVPESVLS